jgi:PAS domain S-box-containing protein
VGVNYLEVCLQAGRMGDDAAADALAGLTDVLRGRRRHFSVEYPSHSPDRRRWFLMDVSPLPPEIGGAVVSHIDISERREAEDALRHSEARQRAILRTSLDCIITIDGDGRVLEWNPAAERTFGYARDQAVGRIISDLIVPPAIRAKHQEGMAKLLALGESSRLNVRLERTAVRADGSEFPVELAVTRIPLDGPPMFTAYFRDVTESNRVKAQLLQSQRMESIGRFAGGVAHDFNNLLAIISGYSEGLLRRIAPADPIREHVEQIELAAERGSALTRQLLAFSLGKETQPRTLDLNEVVRSVHQMLRRVIPSNISIELRTGQGLHPIEADPGQIEQILLNLTLNARDAMPDGGSLTLETANVLPQDRRSPATPAPRAGYVRLSVIDTGLGMDEPTCAHIFEPFFTTKERPGTGLGLWIVYGIMERSHGSISVTSQPGHGTTFDLFFPTSEPI